MILSGVIRPKKVNQFHGKGIFLPELIRHLANACAILPAPMNPILIICWKMVRINWALMRNSRKRVRMGNRKQFESFFGRKEERKLAIFAVMRHSFMGNMVGFLLRNVEVEQRQD